MAGEGAVLPSPQSAEDAALTGGVEATCAAAAAGAAAAATAPTPSSARTVRRKRTGVVRSRRTLVGANMKQKDPFVRFCVKWSNVFLIIACIYGGIVLYMYVLISSPSTNGGTGSKGGGSDWDLVGDANVTSPMKAAFVGSVLHQVKSNVVDRLGGGRHPPPTGDAASVGGGGDGGVNAGGVGNSGVVGGASGIHGIGGSPSRNNNMKRSRVLVDPEQVSIIQEMEEKLHPIFQPGKIRSCRRRSPQEGGGASSVLLANLRRGAAALGGGSSSAAAAALYSADGTCPAGSGAKSIVYYNPLEKSRYVCGKKIGGESTLELPVPCGEPARLYPTIPKHKNIDRSIEPIVARFQDPAKRKAKKPFQQCDVPCYEAGFPALLSTRTIDDTPFSLTFSMEGPKYYQSLNIDPKAYRSNKYYSTTSYQSEVPLPYFSWAEYKIQSPAVQYDDAIKGTLFMARNCKSKNGREEVVKFLRDDPSIRLDSVSTCLNNAQPPPGSNLGNKVSVMQKYLFYLAFENQNVDDYITEKLWGAFESGVLPVYMGAPNIKDHVPENSIINVLDFDSNEALRDHLNTVANNKELYESYHAWRYKPLPPHFHQKYDFTEVHSTCRTCRWAYAKKYGLGWDHYNQTVRELIIPRDVCLDDTGRITKPFIENWTKRSSLSSEGLSKTGQVSTCNLGSQNRILPVDGGKIKRTIWERDGIIDIVIESLESKLSDYVFSLTTGLQTETISMKDLKDGHIRIQDDQSRFTLLFEPKHGVISKLVNDEATVQIVIKPELIPVHIRVIVEDIDKLHEGAEEVENYFAEQMIEDFYYPVEGFLRM